MYHIKSRKEQYTILSCQDTKSDSWFEIVPERGGIVTSYGVHGQELLYLDKHTLLDEQANIRGGIPVLWPICGQLEQGAYSVNGQQYQMKQHGVARRQAWSVLRTQTDEHAGIVTLQLKSNEETKREFPFEFELIFDYQLQDGELTIDQSFKNLSSEAMPMYAGLHPYFQTKSKFLSYETDAKNYMDYNDFTIKPFTGSVDLTSAKESILLLDATERQIVFTVPGEQPYSIAMTYDSPYKYVMLWTVEEKPFLCVEPWMAKADAMHTGEDLLWLEPGSSLQTSVQFRKQ